MLPTELILDIDDPVDSTNRAAVFRSSLSLLSLKKTGPSETLFSLSEVPGGSYDMSLRNVKFDAGFAAAACGLLSRSSATSFNMSFLRGKSSF